MMSITFPSCTWGRNDRSRVPLIWMMGGDSFSTSGNLKCTVYSISGATKTGIRSSFLIRDCASDDLAAL